MDELLSKYSTQKKKGVPRSERAEQIQKVVEITGKPFIQIAGLTKHLQPDVMYRLFQESKGDPRLWWWLFDNKYKKNNMSLMMKELLQKHPDFRERKNKNLFLAKHTLRTVFEVKETKDQNGNLQKETTTLLDKQKRMEVFTLNDFARFGQKFSSLDRDWRDTLRDNKELRGTDYEEKDMLEEIELKRLNYR